MRSVKHCQKYQCFEMMNSTSYGIAFKTKHWSIIHLSRTKAESEDPNLVNGLEVPSNFPSSCGVDLVSTRNLHEKI